ncbi:helix-turn-helix domain-containing protein [Labrys sp. KB_33_2]|uniref:helix-turn-helix domain-containing protein n=1 Tax=Labrys sp. KB_33_2 TaxID=3237479 RepID=UPI003F8FAB3C
MNAYSKVIAERVIEFRKKHGLTQTELGTKLGVGQSTIVRWEKGALPRFAAFKKFLEYARESGDEDIAEGFLSGKTEPLSPRTFIVIEGTIGNASAVTQFGKVPEENRAFAWVNLMLPASSWALLVLGDGMRPKYDEGDLVCLSEKVPKKIDMPFLGYVEDWNGNAFLGRVMRAAKSDEVQVFCFNADPIAGLNPNSISAVEAVIPRGKWSLDRDPSRFLPPKFQNG